MLLLCDILIPIIENTKERGLNLRFNIQRSQLQYLRRLVSDGGIDKDDFYKFDLIVKILFY